MGISAPKTIENFQKDPKGVLNQSKREFKSSYQWNPLFSQTEGTRTMVAAQRPIRGYDGNYLKVNTRDRKWVACVFTLNS